MLPPKKLDRGRLHAGRAARLHRRRSRSLPDDPLSRLSWLFDHGIMPLFTPLGGSYLNMAESVQRILKRRALDGQHPKTPEQIIDWLEATARGWNREPTPFVWGGKRQARRQRARERRHALGGSGAYTRRPLRRRWAA
jgi:hypothetical protein